MKPDAPWEWHFRAMKRYAERIIRESEDHYPQWLKSRPGPTAADIEKERDDDR